MNVRLTLTFDDVARRKIRAMDKRGGKASRGEAMAFTALAIRAMLDRCPEPKVRRPKIVIIEKRASMAVTPPETVEEVRDQNKKIAKVFERKAVS